MSTEPAAGRKPGFRRAVATVAVFALAAVVVGTVLILGDWVSASIDRSDKRSEALTARIDALTESQKLVVAQLTAQGSRPETGTATGTATNESHPSNASAATPHSVVPFTISGTESNMGVHAAVIRFGPAGAATTGGWPVTVQYGNYLDGMSAFNTAAKRGDVFQGQYYVDASTQTVSARLLRGAAVTVYGWAGTVGAGASSRVSAADLAHALDAGGGAGRLWRAAWFWVKLGPHAEVLAAVETPPQ